MRLNVTTIRWLLVVPAAWVAWYSAALIGIAIYSVGDAMCPLELMESGWCNASWHPTFMKCVLIITASISAIFSILAGSYTAPNYRSYVANLILLVGAAFSIFFGLNSEQYVVLVSTLLCGFITARLVVIQSRKVNAA